MVEIKHGSMVYEFNVNIRPAPKDRPRASLMRKGTGYAVGKNGRPIIMFNSTKRSEGFEGGLKLAVRTQLQERGIKARFPMTGPVELGILLRIPLPEKGKQGSRMFLPACKPDLDNYEKAVMDAMNGLLYKDDAQVVTKAAKKSFTDSRACEGVTIMIRELITKEENHI